MDDLSRGYELDNALYLPGVFVFGIIYKGLPQVVSPDDVRSSLDAADTLIREGLLNLLDANTGLTRRHHVVDDQTNFVCVETGVVRSTEALQLAVVTSWVATRRM